MSFTKYTLGYAEDLAFVLCIVQVALVEKIDSFGALASNPAPSLQGAT